MDAKEVVKGLREYAAGELLIHHFELMPRIDEAADCIESLQALLYDYIVGTKKLKEQIARLQDSIDQTQLEKYLTAEQLAESQQRENAAVEDIREMLYRSMDCIFCANQRDGRVLYGPCGADICRDRAKWRGPQHGEGD